MDVAINSDHIRMHRVLIGLLTDTAFVLGELNLYLFRDNADTNFSLITESFPQLHSPTAQFPTPYLYFPNFYLASSLPLLQGRAGIACDTSRSVNFVVLNNNNNNNKVIVIIIDASRCNMILLFSSPLSSSLSLSYPS